MARTKGVMILPKPRNKGRGRGGTIEAAPDNKGGRRRPQRPPARRPQTGERGVIVSIGPQPNWKRNKFIKEWLTFPLTPQSIPIRHGATWAKSRTITGPERSKFIGRNLDQVTFQGQLEPPAFYEPVRGRVTDWEAETGNVWRGEVPSAQFKTVTTAAVTLDGGNLALPISVPVKSTRHFKTFRFFIGSYRCQYLHKTDGSFHGVYVENLSGSVLIPAGTEVRPVSMIEPDGQVDPSQAYQLSDEVTTRGYHNSMGIPQFAGGTGVVMQEGAHAGPSNFYEPHIFAHVLERSLKTGELMRLVIGDQYGWNGIVAIHEFEWRFEDPDPDTLYFQIAFEEYKGQKIAGARDATQVNKGRRKRQPYYTTNYGDKLIDIAVRELHDATKWPRLVKLNRRLLEKLVIYPTGYPHGENDKPTIGRRIPGRSDGKKLGDLSNSRRFPPELRFRQGVRLLVDPQDLEIRQLED